MFNTFIILGKKCNDSIDTLPSKNVDPMFVKGMLTSPKSQARIVEKGRVLWDRAISQVETPSVIKAFQPIRIQQDSALQCISATYTNKSPN